MDWEILNDSRKELVWKLGLKDSVFDDLITRYVDNNLAYHNLTHIADSIRLYKQFKYLADNHLAVQSATWFHDAINIPGVKDNELKSGELGKNILLDNGLSKAFASHVYDIVVDAVFSKVSDDKDVILMRDIDFAILGSDDSTYRNYYSKIRSEYWFLSDDTFALGRKNFLEGLLTNPIFVTSEFKDLYQKKAEYNISQEILMRKRYLESMKS